MTQFLGWSWKTGLTVYFFFHRQRIYTLYILPVVDDMAERNRPRVFVVGVGLTKFERPLTKQWDYPDMGKEAG